MEYSKVQYVSKLPPIAIKANCGLKLLARWGRMKCCTRTHEETAVGGMELDLNQLTCI